MAGFNMMSRRVGLSVTAAFFIAVCALSTSARAQFGSKSDVRTEQVQATLLAHAPQGVPVGLTPEAASSQPVWVGLQIKHAPEWHTYWKNPGDSGLPTDLQWTLPPGVMAGDIAWPLPKKIPIGHLANYGYDGTVLLPVPLTITPEYKPSIAAMAEGMEVKLKANWLVCRQECIPQSGEFALKLPLRSSTALNGPAFEAALKSQPAPVQGSQRIELTHDGQRLAVRVAGLPASARGKTLELFAETPGVIVTAAKLAAAGQPVSPTTWSQRWEGDVWTADLPVSPERAESPAMMPLVLTTDDRQGWRTEALVSGTWPALAAAPGISPALEAALTANAQQAGTKALAPTSAVPLGTFVLTLLGALLGGMVLNLMPCVFPVLAIKVLEFTRHADDVRTRHLHGWAYSVGVVLSFLLLGALMLALRAAGDAVGWGFQLQSPAVVAALAALFTLIGLNLVGVFELRSILPSSLATLQARHPVVNAFLSGVLAVAVASPCTAPFMGASLGLAATLPAAQALLVFVFIGLGMALPYLAISWWPALARALPRPGAWMDVLRKTLAFPMFATVAWLVWVLGQQSGINGAASLLLLLIALAWLVWAWGLSGRLRWWLGGSALALSIALLGWLGPWVVREDASAASAPAAALQEGRWLPWSADRVTATLSAGQPVFVDFTAAWCVTCQVNKTTTLSNAEALAALDAAGVKTFRADWTRRDAAITAELQKLGRSGVPVYVLQAPGKPPIVLSEVLSVADVKAALAQL